MTWTPDAARFLADLEAKPIALRRLADRLEAGGTWDLHRPRRVVLVGMGSSWYAAQVGAARLRGLGIDAWAERASAGTVHPGGPGTLAIGISASGGTDETVESLRRHAERGSDTVALTNAVSSSIGEVAAREVQMLAGPEEGGVACRSFQHTVALLLDLEASLGGDVDTPAVIRRTAEATEDLLERRSAWLEEAVERLTATGQTFLIAPAERTSSAEQGALMLREGPRIVADACETGDWLHVDVYLTKPLDYRALLFVGSRFDDAAMGWVRERGATVVAVGGDVEGAASSVRYRHDRDPEVALLTEVLVPELVAASLWAGRAG
jgi:glucosamine 6-phosphate synthetase-like amidotransferase/phosphosugar isomerase protein